MHKLLKLINSFNFWIKFAYTYANEKKMNVNIDVSKDSSISYMF